MTPMMKKTLFCLTAALLIGAAPAHGQLFKNRNTGAKTPQAAVPSGPFNADDPFDKVNNRTAGTPWEQVSAPPVELPEGVKAVIPEPLPDIDKISAIDYNTAVSTAFESLRLIYGDMSEQEAGQFLEMWAPLFDYPTQEIIDYLNKLNPLLSQFIVARETYMNSVENLQLLALDANEAVEWEDKEAFKSAMFQARLYGGTAKQLEAAMVEIANRIQALGNPPNPLQARAEARRRYNRAFPSKEIYLGETWMGTRPDPTHSLPQLGPLTEVMMRYLLKVKVNGEDRWFVLELKEEGIPEESEDDPHGLSNLRVEQMYFSDKGNLMPDFKSDGTFQTYYPKPPAMAITMLTINLMRQYESSYVNDEDRKDPQFAQMKQEYHELAGHYGNRVTRGGIFFKTALLWAMENKWSQYEWKDDGVVPHALIEDFEEAIRKQAVIEVENSKNVPKLKIFGGGRKSREEAGEAAPDSNVQVPMNQDDAKKQYIRDSLAREEQSKQESIRFHEENIRIIENNIRRDEESRRAAMSRLYAAKSAGEKESIQREIEDYDRRLMYQRSDIQSERDNINGLRTGQFVHTRSEFDNYAFNKVIVDAKVEAERYNRTKKAAAILDKQINDLPEDQRDAMRDRADKLFYEDGALASGDFEKVRKLAGLVENQRLANELKVQAEAQEEVAWADIKEAGANAVIMACGSVTVGLAGEALAGAYGTTAAATIWGTRAVGAVYGGMTGYLSGGPGKAASSAAGFFHPVTGAIASFIEGATAEGTEGMSVYERLWEGTKAAGKDYLVGKAFEIGATAFAKSAAAILPDGIVNFNLTGSLTSKQKLDVLRTQRERLEAEDAVKAFTKMNDEYIHLRAEAASGKNVPAATLDEMRKNINQMAASMNSDYHAKWFMKYKATPMQRAHFDQAVQANYREMYPKMTQRLQDMKYDMSDIEFKQFRNSSSSGSSSMDLDLAPVSKSTGKEPVFFKDGKKTTAAEFMRDAQETMNTVYREQHHISAKASEMNLTTSAHPEAYKTAELLKKDVDYSKLKPEEIASIGDVLEVKVNTIEGNIRMTETTKLQAKCREATKEVENMLIPKLKQELKNATNVKDAERIAADIEYWQAMDRRLSSIGKETSDPHAIHRLNNEMRRATGGKDAVQVVNDLINAFRQ